MENWRQFVEQQETITIDESLVIPEFLKRDLNEELLSEVETDPEALSLADLKAMPAEDIIKIYDNLVPKQADTKANQDRAARQQQRKQAKSAASEKIFNFEESGIFNKVLNAAKVAINNLLGTDLEAFDIKTEEEKEELLRRKVNDNIMEEFSAIEREIIRSIFLFTGANVPTVREPENFAADDAEKLKFGNKSITAMFTPTKETYQKAKVILAKLQQKKAENSPNLFRGIKMVLNDSKHVPISAYSVGRNIDVGTFMSFTTELNVAKNFSAVNSDTDQYVSTIFYVPPGKMKRGMYVSEYSQYEDEEEFITSGEFKITNIVAIIGRFESLNEMLKNSKQYKNFEDISQNLKFNGFSFGQFFEGSLPEDTQEGAGAWLFFKDKVKVGVYMEQI